MKSKTIVFLLLLIIIIGAALRLYGFEWGIPRAPHWRNHYQDEAFVLGLLFKMGPDNLNPHYFINPTLHYYTLLTAIKTASVAGYIKPFRLPVPTNNLGQPARGLELEDYRRMYQVGRGLCLLESILLILLIYGIGRNLYGPVAGLVGAAFTAVLPTFCYQSRFLVVDAPAVFWLILAFWFITTTPSPARRRPWALMAGLFIGLAIGAKYTNILVVIPFLHRFYQLHRSAAPPPKIFFHRDLLYAGLTAAAFFFFSTPYALLSTAEFLHGDSNGFGGIFGRRGLLYYNNYPANLITPFTVATLQSLRLPLSVLCLAVLVWRLIRHRAGDVTIFCFLVPFYGMLVTKASPHLRHIMPVLPLLMILLGAAWIDPPVVLKRLPLRIFSAGLGAGILIYTLLFSAAYVGRMSTTDTRIASAEWMNANLPRGATIGMATYFPWNYTPPVENVFDPDRIIVTGYDYERLRQQRPVYFIITEYEYRELAYHRGSRYLARQFVDRLFQEKDYELIKEFSRDFSVLGIRFHPDFPNLDWNPVNPRILIYCLKS